MLSAALAGATSPAIPGVESGDAFVAPGDPAVPLG